MNHELALARPTLRIAVVSSATAAGYRDFIKEISRAPYRFEITLFESLMQGDGAENSIIGALHAIAEREEEYDVVAIIRGGGSTSDLALFDSYRIASHVAQFPLPIITGIGHDKDISVTDMVAHTMCKTPTAVATLLVEGIDAEITLVANIATEIFTLVNSKLHDESLRVVQYLMELQRHSSERLQSEMFKLDTIGNTLHNQLDMFFTSEHQRLDDASRLIESYSVANILKLGFAVLRSTEGIITSIHDANIGERVSIELDDGSIDAEIKSINEKAK
jgi:exodeoxyribonuclease VII large subunit